jgi:hypothetical protein
MSPRAASLAMILAIVGLGAIIGFLAGVRGKMNLEQWTVGGRGFGTVLMFLLMAGEVYTTFSFLGASGWAYSRRPNPVHLGLPHARLRDRIFYPARNLGSGTEVQAARRTEAEP